MARKLTERDMYSLLQAALISIFTDEHFLNFYGLDDQDYRNTYAFLHFLYFNYKKLYKMYKNKGDFLCREHQGY